MQTTGLTGLSKVLRNDNRTRLLASEDSFDRDRVFLNEEYDAFTEIYYSDMPYTVYDANSLLEGQLELAHK